MGTWHRNSVGRYESYFPDIGEIVSYPRGPVGEGIVTRCHGVHYDLVNHNGSATNCGVWDMQPATDAEKARLRARVDLSRIPLDRTFQNRLPCGAIGHREFLRAASARVKRIVCGEAA